MLHRLHTGHNQGERDLLEEHLGTLLQDLQIDQLESSDWLILDMRTVLRMRRRLVRSCIQLNLTLEEPILESPTGPGGYVQDAGQWQYLENTDFGYGVKKSWALLSHIEHRLEPTPPLVAVVDSGFNLNDDLEAVESVHLLGEPSARVQEESHGTQIAGVIAATKTIRRGSSGGRDHSD